MVYCATLHPIPRYAGDPVGLCAMSKRNYRGELGRQLGRGLNGNLIYQGRRLWSVESMGTDGLAAVMLSALAHRGEASAPENILRLSLSKAFWRASGPVREATLGKYYAMDRLFGSLRRRRCLAGTYALTAK